jgi:hypothetical protein
MTASEWFERGRKAGQEKDYEEAIRCFKHALDDSPFDPNILAFLGFAYLMNGNTDSAQRYLKESLHINPSQTKAQKYLDICNNIISQGKSQLGTTVDPVTTIHSPRRAPRPTTNEQKRKTTLEEEQSKVRRNAWLLYGSALLICVLLYLLDDNGYIFLFGFVIHVFLNAMCIGLYAKSKGYWVGWGLVGLFTSILTIIPLIIFAVLPPFRSWNQIPAWSTGLSSNELTTIAKRWKVLLRLIYIKIICFIVFRILVAYNPSSREVLFVGTVVLGIIELAQLFIVCRLGIVIHEYRATLFFILWCTGMVIWVACSPLDYEPSLLSHPGPHMGIGEVVLTVVMLHIFGRARNLLVGNGIRLSWSDVWST